MINSDYQPEDDLNVVDGNFTVNADVNDPGVFFNLNLNNNVRSNKSMFSQDFGGFSNNLFEKKGFDDTTITTPTYSAQTNPAQTQQCTGNCHSCIWSFMCNSAQKSLSSLGGGYIPRLG
ncbi:hypothetical protein GPJ56_005264 [Histomonas meleagridis]|uniref:uncharacterized protein n=1 Tax=Histomonas meleagridis TaxID=135588 RepID=UPI00355970D3|nr:hypothetical protein GPJ56_005264 [Histomonas meleagridis]KAH0802114.1 hypothetical protein GO595_005195 [Histomonas meleagridis]